MSIVVPGQLLWIPAGKQIIRAGVPTRQRRASVVTVRTIEPARNGKTRAIWKSMGYNNSVLV